MSCLVRIRAVSTRNSRIVSSILCDNAAKDTIKKLGFDVPVERVGKVVEFRVEFVAQAPPAEAEPGAASAAAAPPAAAPSPFANPAPGSVEVKVEASCFNRTVTQGEVDVAMAVDDVAAELQLGGRWN